MASVCFILKDSVMKRLEFFILIFVALLVTNVAVAQRGRGSGESKTITPFCADGADVGSTEVKG